MAALIRMPEVLAGVTEAAVQSWLVQLGDTVGADTPLAEIETEKAMVEFSGEHAGTIVELLVPAGTTVEVGEPIVILRQEGDSEADLAAVRALAGGDAGSVAAGAVTEDDAAAASVEDDAAASAAGAAEQQERQFSSPIVRRLAREHGVELAAVTGTGPNGRIVRRDLEAHLASGAATSGASTSQAPASSSPPSPATPAPEQAPAQIASTTGTSGTEQPGEIIPLSGMRKAIARRLTESKSTVPHFYLTAHCRVDALLALRKTVNETATKKVSVNDFVVKAAGQALIDVPGANAIWGGDHIRRFDTADISVAVSTEGGLLTPVVRSVEKLSLTSLSERVADLATRAREGKLQQHELEGGSFAISNLGMFGVAEFSAILNPPQSGILAVGAASQRPVVENGELSVGTVMTVTLSADHRVIDGALAAQWLAAFQARIEQPLSILL